MKTIALTINGRRTVAAIEPRTHLADLLRENERLTGTHLGCEQGVCGACTVLVDGVPVRSCITYAVACEGAEVTSIEGLDDDPLTAELRQAFTKHHGLQCGYCTPGMLIMARDIVSRLADADDQRIRIELSGNLCRCTGYVGIVRAIRSVIDDRRSRGIAAAGATARGLGPAGSRPEQGPDGTAAERLVIEPAETAAADARHSPAADGSRFGGTEPALDQIDKRGTKIRQSFRLACPPADAWVRFGDVERMVACLPGASLIELTPNGRIHAKMRVRLGPIAAEFVGHGMHERDQESLTGVIRGAGSDARSASLAQGEIRYSLAEENGGQSTRVDIDVIYALSGALAQFARTGIVTGIIGRMTAQFAQNLQDTIRRSHQDPGSARPSGAETARDFHADQLLLSALRDWLKGIFGRFLMRK